MHTSIPEYLKKAHCLPFLLSHKIVVFRMKLISVYYQRKYKKKLYGLCKKYHYTRTQHIKIYIRSILYQVRTILYNIIKYPPVVFRSRYTVCNIKIILLRLVFILRYDYLVPNIFLSNLQPVQISPLCLHLLIAVYLHNLQNQLVLKHRRKHASPYF